MNKDIDKKRRFYIYGIAIIGIIYILFSSFHIKSCYSVIRNQVRLFNNIGLDNDTIVSIQDTIFEYKHLNYKYMITGKGKYELPLYITDFSNRETISPGDVVTKNSHSNQFTVIHNGEIIEFTLRDVGKESAKDIILSDIIIIGFIMIIIILLMLIPSKYLVIQKF
jgi:hypothetical protein